MDANVGKLYCFLCEVVCFLCYFQSKEEAGWVGVQSRGGSKSEGPFEMGFHDVLVDDICPIFCDKGLVTQV